jgi:hypothetical protein
MNCDQSGSMRPKISGEGKRGGAEGKKQDSHRPWQDLPTNEILFCPVSGWDLTPLQLVGDLASVFVLADWRFGPEVFEKSIWPDIAAGKHSGLRPAVDNQNSVIAVPDEEVLSVSGPSSDFGTFHEPAWVSGVPSWCRIARAIHHAGDQKRPLLLVYIVGNCVQIYERLFGNRGTAPKILWLECPLGAHVDRWEGFISPDGEFGRVFTRSACQPKYVAAERCQPGWAQRVRCGQLPTNLPPFKLTVLGVPGASLV